MYNYLFQIDANEKLVFYPYALMTRKAYVVEGKVALGKINAFLTGYGYVSSVSTTGFVSFHILHPQVSCMPFLIGIFIVAFCSYQMGISVLTRGLPLSSGKINSRELIKEDLKAYGLVWPGAPFILVSSL